MMGMIPHLCFAQPGNTEVALPVDVGEMRCKPGSHFVTTKSCDDCHRTTSWSRVSSSPTWAPSPPNCIPSGVSVGFGTCPPPSSDGDGLDMGAGSPGRRYADCVILAEIPSPSVSAPASVDVAQLAQIGLEFTGMTSDQAAAFTSTVDWTSTLVVPIPKNAASYQQITVDGVTGTLIQRPADDAPQFVLIWVKDGIIYAIGGLGSNSSCRTRRR